MHDPERNPASKQVFTEGKKMVGFQRVDGVPEPAIIAKANGNPAAPKTQSQVAPAKDEVLISDKARQVSEAVRAAKAKVSEVRAEQIAKAQEDLEQGTHRVVDLVRFIAGRVGVQMDS